MSERHPLYGLMLAAFGALVITPDTLFMRWTGMGGTQMLAWRCLASGAMMIATWVILRGGHLREDLFQLRQRTGLAVVVSHSINATLFALGVANAPVAVVLFGVATVPICAALLGHLLTHEKNDRATWLATFAVLGGIGLAVFGRDSTGVGINMASAIGAAAGIGVALAVAFTLVMIRKHPSLPILPAMGSGSLIAGLTAMSIVGPQVMMQGNVPAALASGMLILPLSFMCLTYASRHTAAVNVSLLMLLETILGPVWVWFGTGEAMHSLQLAGGAVVVVTLAVYIVHGSRRAGDAATA